MLNTKEMLVEQRGGKGKQGLVVSRGCVDMERPQGTCYRMGCYGEVDTLLRS